MTAYDVHFIVNNKYYAMKIQEKSESFPEIPEIPDFLVITLFCLPVSFGNIKMVERRIYLRTL